MTEPITILSETANSPVQVGGKRWLVTVARPGQGATGFYSEEVLKKSGPTAIPAGTKSYFKHAASQDRDPRDQVGTFEEGAFWNDEEGELQAILTPFPRYAQVLEEAGKNIEASVRVAARKKKNTDVVSELLFRRDNTVDLVAFAGLEGSGLKYQVESLFAEAAAEANQENEEENNVEIEKAVEAMASELKTFAARFDTFVAESKLEVKGEADADAVEAAVEARVAEALAGYAEVEKAIDAADIPNVVKESLKDAARKGEDVTDTLAGAVAIVVETKKELTPAPNGRKRDTVVVVAESLDSDKPKNFRVGRWSN